MALQELPRIAEDQMMNWTGAKGLRGEAIALSEDDVLGDNQYEVGDIETIRISCYEFESES